MLTLLLAAAALAWAGFGVRARFRRRHARDLAEAAAYPSLGEYIASREHPVPSSRWAADTERDRIP